MLYKISWKISKLDFIKLFIRLVAIKVSLSIVHNAFSCSLPCQMQKKRPGKTFLQRQVIGGNVPSSFHMAL